MQSISGYQFDNVFFVFHYYSHRSSCRRFGLFWLSDFRTVYPRSLLVFCFPYRRKQREEMIKCCVMCRVFLGHCCVSQKIFASSRIRVRICLFLYVFLPDQISAECLTNINSEAKTTRGLCFVSRTSAQAQCCEIQANSIRVSNLMVPSSDLRDAHVKDSRFSANIATVSISLPIFEYPT